MNKTVLSLAAGLAASAVLPGVASAVKEGELLIWINGDKGYRGLQQVGDKFAEELGVPVKVEAPEGVTDKFFQAAQSDKGPDIFFWAHDRLGEWADAGILRPIEVSSEYKEKFFDKGWEAFTHNGRIWAYPLSLEGPTLVYNKDVIKNPPKTLEEIIERTPEIREQEVEPIMWDYNNTYFTWGILAADGGYVFGKNESGYDVADVGVNHAGAVAGLEMIVKMIDEGVMPRGVSYNVMDAKMNSGEVAMMINGPWSWANLRKSGINFGVAPTPGINGKPGKAFVGVVGAMINRASPNVDLAEEFLKNYLMTPEGLKMVNDDVPLGVPALKAFYEQLASDELTRNLKLAIDEGQLMPNIPQMGRFWSSMGSALSNATNGQVAPKEALDLAAKRIAPRK